jgi:uncharacterized protein (TIGR00369 family)
MIDGKILQPPMTATLGFRLTDAEHGRAVFTGEPRYEYYNPLGSVHAGFAATLLDSALGCAVHSTLAKGETYVTAEFKLNLVRPLTKDTGTVTAEGRIVHRGRTLGTSEGYLRDVAGKLYAHATTTCIIFPATG